MNALTLEGLKAEHVALGERIAQLEAQATTTLALQGRCITLAPGEHYAGLILGADGTPSHHLILLPGQVQKPWDDAVEWAKSIGGELPTRSEQALLYANLKGKFEAAWYWSSEQCSEGYAWTQHFYDGDQSDDAKSYQARACAVRRVPV